LPASFATSKMNPQKTKKAQDVGGETNFPVL